MAYRPVVAPPPPGAPMLRYAQPVPQAAAAPAEPPAYSYYAENKLLLLFEGANNSTTFIDSSQYGQTITAVNGAKISTAAAKWGASSGFFDGVNDHLTVPHHARLNLETSDFTIDLWAYRAVSGAFHYLLSKRHASVANGWEFRINSTNKLQFFYTGGSSLIGTLDVPSGAWSFIRCTRLDNTVSLAVNGVSAGSGTFANGTLNTTDTLKIGVDNILSTPYSGYIGGLRIIKGVALPLTAVPTEQFPTA